MENKIAAVTMKGVTKRFGSVVALSGADLEVYKGEVLSLLGENGSGKTTLMNMLSGIYFPDEGDIFVNEKKVIISSPKDAYELGIGMVHQHFKLIDVLTAAENIVLGQKGKLNLREAKTRIKEICDRYGFDVDPDKKIYDMSVSEKQTVEIVKVLFRNADVLILDEPTAVLTPQETEKLFAVMRNMRDDNKAIIIITHKLNEVEEISDRVSILRKGEYIGTLKTSETNAEEMTNMMVGREVTLNIDRFEPVDPKTRIQVEGLTVRSSDGVLKLKDISFEARSGEILGIAGISGCGQKELLESIAGLQKAESGSIKYTAPGSEETAAGPEELIGKRPLDIAKLGITLSFVPEDRLGMGLVGSMDLSDNMMLRSYRNGRGFFTDRKAPRELAGKVVKTLEVVTPNLDVPVKQLSGGNVQKILLGREIALQPTVLMTAYAVRGLDINSSYTIYDMINIQKEKGVAVIFVGEDLDILLALSDRILVLCDGEVSAVLDARTTNKNEVGLYMTKKGGMN